MDEKTAKKGAEAFGDLIIAGLMDAAVNRKLSQFKIRMEPNRDGKVKMVRVIIVPEEMDLETHPDHPIGT